MANDIDIIGTAGAIGIHFAGTFSAAAVGTATATFTGDGNGVVDSIGVFVAGPFALDNYQGSMSGATATLDNVDCTGVRISSTSVSIAGSGQTFAITGFNSCSASGTLHRGVELLPSALSLSFIDFILDGETSGINAPDSVAILMTNVNANTLNAMITIRARVDAISVHTGLEIVNSDFSDSTGSTINIIEITDTITGTDSKRVRFTNTTMSCESFSIDASTGNFHGGVGTGTVIFNSDITASDVTIMSESGVGGTGVTLKRSNLMVSGPVTIIGQGGQAGGLTRGVVLLTSAVSGTIIDITGTVISSSGSDHKGLLIDSSDLTATLPSFLRGDASVTTGGVGLNGIELSQVVQIVMGGDLVIDGFGGDNGSGVLVQFASAVDFSGAVVVTMTGVCGSTGIAGNGVEVGGSLSVGTGTALSITGDSSSQSGFYFGVAITGTLAVAAGGTVNINGLASANSGDGISFGGDLSLGTGSALSATGISGVTGGNGISYTNSINTPLDPCQLSLTGMSSGGALSNVGVLWSPSSGVYGDAVITILGNGGGTSTSSESTGVLVAAPLVSTASVSITGTGGLGISGATGVDVRAAVSSADIVLTGVGGGMGDFAQGCAISAAVTAASTLMIDGTSSSSELDNIGVFTSAPLQAGTDLFIDGLATASSSIGCSVNAPMIAGGSTSIECVWLPLCNA